MQELSSLSSQRGICLFYFLLMNTQQVKEVLIIPDAVYIFSHFNYLKVRMSICLVPSLVKKIRVMKLTRKYMFNSCNKLVPTVNTEEIQTIYFYSLQQFLISTHKLWEKSAVPPLGNIFLSKNN